MIGFNETLRGKYMDSFMGKIQSAYGFSDYEIRLIRYSMTALFYDCSKLVIFGIFYYLTGDFKAFLFELFPAGFILKGIGAVSSLLLLIWNFVSISYPCFCRCHQLFYAPLYRYAL